MDCMIKILIKEKNFEINQMYRTTKPNKKHDNKKDDFQRERSKTIKNLFAEYEWKNVSELVCFSRS